MATRKTVTLSEIKCSTVLGVFEKLPYVVRVKNHVGVPALCNWIDQNLDDGKKAYISLRMEYKGKDPSIPTGFYCYEVFFQDSTTAKEFAEFFNGQEIPAPFEVEKS